MVALVCLFAFLGLGVLYFQNWVVQKPFAIILFVAEGLSARDLAAARLYIGGADARTSFDAMPHVALLKNASDDFAVADEAAAATAIATGVRVRNGSLGVDTNGERLTTLLELAPQHGRATGLISDSRLTNAVCAGFFAHSANADDGSELARMLVDEQKIDIVLGGGVSDFLPREKGGKRTDNRDLLLSLRTNGYDIARTRSELEGVPAWRRGRLFGVFAEGDLAFADETQNDNEQPALSDMVRRAIELLQYNRHGYVLVVNAGLIRKAAADNQGERRLRQLAEVERAVAVAHRYAGPRSTIIVCGEVAVGGMAINGTPFRRDSGVALLGMTARGEPWITWATGPNGLTSYGGSKLPAENNQLVDAMRTEPAAFYSKQALPVVEDVIALGSGAGTESLGGIRESTDIFKIVADNL